SAEEERGDFPFWRTVIIGEREPRIKMKNIDPKIRVISHGGL
ncbi:unnamed protein product, partial [Tetraodon nigroviridis]